jgi:hypothetical protein
MSDDKKPDQPTSASGSGRTTGPKITRRRFAKAGALAPVIMTLGGRPVWGQTCSPSALDSFSHASHAACEAPRLVSSSASEWFTAASRGSWPTATDFPGFHAAPSDLCSSHFGVRFAPKRARKDVESLLGQNLSKLLLGATGVNGKLSRLAQQAAAARLNALFAEALAIRIGATQDLFPLRPDAVVAEFWNALQEDCTGLGRGLKAKVKNSKDKDQDDDSDSGYDEGAAMSALAAQLEELNESGTSFL